VRDAKLVRPGLILLAILLAALFTRIYQLNTEDLWLDEAIAVSISNNSLGGLLESSLPDGNPPLYYLLLHYWMWLFGDSEFSVRLPSALFGLFSVAMIYKVGSILFGKATGLIGALILALSVYHIFYSQEARTYSLMVLLALVSYYFFLRLFESENHKVLIGYVLSTTALMYSHYYGLFFVVAQTLFLVGFYSLGRRRERAPGLKTWALAGGAVATLYVPGFLYLAYVLTHPEHRGWIEDTVFGELDLVSVLLTYAVYAQAPGLRAPKYYFALLVLFAATSAVVLAASKGERGKLYLLSLWLLVPIALPLLLSQIVTPLVHARYSIAALPAFYLLAAEGIRRVGRVAMRAPTNLPVPLAALCGIGVLFVVTAFSSLDMLHRYFTTEKKEPWRTVVSEVEPRATPGDLFIISPEESRFPFDYYASREVFFAQVQEVSLDEREQANEVGSVASGSDRVWLVLQIEDDNKEEQFKAELEKAGFEATDHKSYPVTHQRGIELMLFEKD
jgi:4-amino-4-deoxy-L-arabinose transferase-like glycosyltransferase